MAPPSSPDVGTTFGRNHASLQPICPSQQQRWLASTTNQRQNRKPHKQPRQATTNSSSRSQPRSKARSTDYVQHWMQRKNHFLSIPLGSLQPYDVEQVIVMIGNLRTHPRLVPLPNRVPIMWELLDRLDREVMMLTTSEPGANLQRRLRLPLDYIVLRGVLLSWRDHVFAVANAGSATKEVLGDLHPMAVLSKVDRYLGFAATSSPGSGAALFEPSVHPYSIILHTLGQMNDRQERVQNGQELVEGMMERSRNNPQNVLLHPSNSIVYGMMTLWAQSKLPESSQKAEEWLEKMQTWWDQTHHENYQLNSNILVAVMEAHSHVSHGTLAFDRINELLVELKNLRGVDPNQDSIHYNRVCNAFAACHHPEAADAARAILDEMCESLKPNAPQSENCLPKPTTYTFSIVMSAYGRMARIDDVVKLFKYLEGLSQEDPSLTPSTHCYLSLIWAYAKVNDAANTEAALMQMIQAKSERGNPTGDLDTGAWNAVLQSWADSGDPNATENIALIIQRLQTICEKRGIKGDVLTAVTYNKLLRSHVKQRNLVEAQKTFRWMQEQSNANVKPDCETYKLMILAFNYVKEAEKSEYYLEELIKEIQSGSMKKVQFDHDHFDIVIGAWAKSNDPKAAERATSVFERMEQLGIAPCVVSYNSLIWAWARSSNRNHVKIVDRIFQRMLKQWEEGKQFIKPNDYTFHGVLFALSRSKDPADLAAGSMLAKQMDATGVPKTTNIYNTLMTLESRRHRPDRVELLFEELKTKYEAGDSSLQPSTEAFITRLKAWSRAGNPEMASKVLRELIANANDFGLEYRTEDFNCVLQAWSRTQRGDAGEKAESGLHQMVEFSKQNTFDCRPDSSSYNAVILAHSNTGMETSGERSFALFKDLKAVAAQQIGEEKWRFEPNFATYGSLVAAICRSSKRLQSSGEDMLWEIFSDIESGLDRSLSTADSDHFVRFNRSNHSLFTKITYELEVSSFPNKETLLTECRRLEDMASSIVELPSSGR